MHGCFACMHVYGMCVQCPQEPEESVKSSGIGITGVCELLCRCWEPNSGPPQGQQVILTVELSL